MEIRRWSAKFDPAGYLQIREDEQGEFVKYEQVQRLKEALEAISKIAEEQWPVSIGNQWAWGEVHASARAALSGE